MKPITRQSYSAIIFIFCYCRFIFSAQRQTHIQSECGGGMSSDCEKKSHRGKIKEERLPQTADYEQLHCETVERTRRSLTA